MNHYIITGFMKVIHSAIIEAESEEEALKFAETIDIDDFFTEDSGLDIIETEQITQEEAQNYTYPKFIVEKTLIKVKESQEWNNLKPLGLLK